MTYTADATTCAAFTQRGMINAASGLHTFVRDLDPIAPSTDVRLKGDFVGTSWSPPV